MKQLKIEDQVCTDIPGYVGLYTINTSGEVFAVKRSGSKGGKLSVINTRGYDRVVLSKDNKRKNHSIHRLLALVYIPNPNNLPCVNHKDGDKANNKLKNLEWCNHQYNSLHATRVLKLGIGEKNGRSKLTEREVNFIRYIKFNNPEITIASISRFYDMSETAISDILNYKNWNNDQRSEIPNCGSM